ncbi:MAG: Nickel uptake substrate-specific transmembrane region [Candidatus Scalindua rubra]|uniref:Nickel uptake substrate-specific transmembrane region n=1 Tax=Candidatus Scalindua rubra TaxID=1872076 RepID=A0A1E3XBR7_9BACT|nr:MAG: Nickel uptake substrate-specific transmembrane region [Candidatus Scalindua rubra]
MLSIKKVNVLKGLRVFMFYGMLAALLSMLTEVQAHTLWVNATDFTPALSERSKSTNIFLGWGHDFPVQDFLKTSDMKDYYFVTPEGGKKDLTPMAQEGFLETKMEYTKEGSHLVIANKKAYTRGKVTRIAFAKAIINVDQSTGDVSKPVGQELEIVPLKNPGLLRMGEYVPVKVLFNGEPLPYAEVLATYAGFSTDRASAYVVHADKEGIAKIRLIKDGDWKIELKHEIPDTQKETDPESETLRYISSLTFEVR